MLDIDYKGLSKIIALILFIAGVIWFVHRISWVIELVLISLVIVYALYPVAEFLKTRFKFNHLLAVVITFSLLIILIITLIGLIVPIIQQEIREILADMPYYLNQLRKYIEEFTEYMTTFNLGPEYLESIQGLSANLSIILYEITNFSFSVVSSLVNIFFILFIVFFLLYDFGNVRDAAFRFIPQNYRKYTEDIVKIIDLNFSAYIRGNIVRCSIVGFLTGLLLYVIGMPYALLLGILAGVLNIILYIGPFLAAIPAILLSFSPYTSSTVVVAAIYLGIQILDGFVLAPLLLGRAVRLKAITVIISLLIGQQLAGFLGMVLSIPIAGIVKNLIEYYQKEKPKVMAGE